MLPAPVRPAAGEPVEDLARIVLRPELVVPGRPVQGGFVRDGAPQPLGHTLFGHALGGRRHAGLAAVLPGEDVDRDLAPAGRHHDILGLKNYRPVRIDDSGGPGTEIYAGIYVVDGRIRALKLHGLSAPWSIYCATFGREPQDVGVKSEFLVGTLRKTWAGGE